MFPTPPLVLASPLDTRHNDKFSANVEPVVFSLARFVDCLPVFLSCLAWTYDSESACNASFVGCPVLALEMEKQARWESRVTQATSRREEESAPKSRPAALGEGSSTLPF